MEEAGEEKAESEVRVRVRWQPAEEVRGKRERGQQRRRTGPDREDRW